VIGRRLLSFGNQYLLAICIVVVAMKRCNSSAALALTAVVSAWIVCTCWRELGASSNAAYVGGATRRAVAFGFPAALTLATQEAALAEGTFSGDTVDDAAFESILGKIRKANVDSNGFVSSSAGPKKAANVARLNLLLEDTTGREYAAAVDTAKTRLGELAATVRAGNKEAIKDATYGTRNVEVTQVLRSSLPRMLSAPEAKTAPEVEEIMRSYMDNSDAYHFMARYGKIDRAQSNYKKMMLSLEALQQSYSFV